MKAKPDGFGNDNQMTQKAHSNMGKWRSRPGRLYRSRIRSAFVLILVCCIVVSTGYSKPESSRYKEYHIKAAFVYNFLKFVDWPEDKNAQSPGEITIGIVGNDPFGKAFDILIDKKVKDRRVVIQRFGDFTKLKESVEAERAKLYRQIQSLRKNYVIIKDKSGNVAIRPLDSLEQISGEKNEEARKKKIEELKKRGMVFVDNAKEENLKVIINSIVQERLNVLKRCHILFVCPSEKQNFGRLIDLVKNSAVLTIADTQGFLEAGGMVNFTLEDNKVRFQVNLSAVKKAKLQIRSQLLRLATKVLRAEKSPSDDGKLKTDKERR